MSASKVVLKVLNICISILLLVLAVFVLIRLGMASYDMGYRVFTEKPMEKSPGRDVVVEVDKNMTALELGTALEEKGLVENAYLFVLQMKLSAYSDKLKPGLYTLSTSQTAREMLQVLCAVKEKDSKNGNKEEESDSSGPDSQDESDGGGPTARMNQTAADWTVRTGQTVGKIQSNKVTA